MRHAHKWNFIFLATILLLCTSCGNKGCTDYEGMYENHQEGRWYVLETDSYQILVEVGPRMSGQIETAESGKLEALGDCQFRCTSYAGGPGHTFAIEGNELAQRDPETRTTTIYIRVR